MERLTPLIRISSGLVALTCSILLVLDLAGMVPAPSEEMVHARVQLCETLAAQSAPAIERNDMAAIRSAMAVAVGRNEDVISSGLRDARGRLIVASNGHRQSWQLEEGAPSSATHVRVPLFKGGGKWGDLEVRFAELPPESFLQAMWSRPVVKLLLGLSTLGFIGYILFMRRTLRHLDPSAVVPTRVQATLDVMSEGVLLIDGNEQIVLANQAFADRVGRSPASLLATPVSKLGWVSRDGSASDALPWLTAMRENRPITGTNLVLPGEDGERAFLVNGSPVLDGWGKSKGAIITFDDVTELEARTAELQRALGELEKSRDEVRLQNQELEVLATSDPLTGAANRRSFMDRFEELFTRSKLEDRPLSCMMVDIDHFKAVNDRHGHGTGDEVICRVAEALRDGVRANDWVCRYGGEEFLVAFPGAEDASAAEVAERLRCAISAPGFSRVAVTASFGIASLVSGAVSAAQLIDQADQALYGSKQGGRDRVTLYTELPNH